MSSDDKFQWTKGDVLYDRKDPAVVVVLRMFVNDPYKDEREMVSILVTPIAFSSAWDGNWWLARPGASGMGKSYVLEWPCQSSIWGDMDKWDEIKED